MVSNVYARHSGDTPSAGKSGLSDLIVSMDLAQIDALMRALEAEKSRRLSLSEISASTPISVAAGQLTKAILAARSAYPGCSREEILGPSQKAGHCRARWHAMRYLRLLGWSYPRIGRAFDRDYSSVSHGIKRLNEEEGN